MTKASSQKIKEVNMVTLSLGFNTMEPIGMFQNWRNIFQKKQEMYKQTSRPVSPHGKLFKF